jgi:hypothetical protein
MALIYFVIILVTNMEAGINSDKNISWKETICGMEVQIGR